MFSQEEGGWSRMIRTQLRKRDQLQAQPYTEIFNHYNQLQSELTMTRFQSRVQSTSSNTNTQQQQQNTAQIRQYISQLVAQNQTLTRDLALMDERNSQNEALLLSRQLKIEQLKEIEQQNKKLQQYLIESEKTLKNAGTTVAEQEKMISAFQRALENLQKENQDLRTSIEQSRINPSLVGGQQTAASVFFGADDIKTEAVAWSVPQPSAVPSGYKYHHRISTDNKCTVNAVAYHGEGSVIVAGTSDGRLLFSQARTGKMGNVFNASKHAITSLASSASRGNIVFTDSDKHLALFDTINRTKPVYANLPSIGLQASYLTSDTVAVINKGRIDSILLYNISTTNAEELLAHENMMKSHYLQTPTQQLQQNTNIVPIYDLKIEQKISTDSTPTAMATHNTTLGIAVSHFDKTLSIWTQGPSSLQKLLTLDNLHGLRITSLHYHPSAPLLLTNSWDARLNIIDTRTGQICYQINGHLANYVNKLENGKAIFCSDGVYVAAGCHDGSVKLWDTRMLTNTLTGDKPIDWMAANNYPGGCVATLAPHASTNVQRAPVTGLEWNQNGKQIVAVDQLNLIAYE